MSLCLYEFIYPLTVPVYEAPHNVLPSPWSYPEDLVSEVLSPEGDATEVGEHRPFDLTEEPPAYRENPDYWANAKDDGELKVRG